jgi:hypothetical protein
VGVAGRGRGVRRGRGARARAAGCGRGGRGGGARRARGDGGGVAERRDLERCWGRGLVDLARAPVDRGGATGVRRLRRFVGARRRPRFPRRRPRPHRTFPRRGPGRRGGAAHPPRQLDRDRRGPSGAGGRRGAAGGGAVLAEARGEPGGPRGGESRPCGPPGRPSGGDPDVQAAGHRRTGDAAGRAALSRVARRGRGKRRAVDAGAGGRPPHGGRRDAGGAEPGRPLGRGAARPERALAGRARDLRRRDAAVRGRRRPAGGGADRGSRGAGGRAQGRAPRVTHRDVGDLARGARSGGRRDQRGTRQPLRAPRAGSARSAGAEGRHRAAHRPGGHHHSHDRRHP